MKWHNYLAPLLLVAMIVAGCGSSDEKSPVTDASEQSTEDGGGEDAGGQDGTSENGSSNTGLPPSASDNFTIAIPDGWEIDILNEIGMTNATGAQLLYPAADFDRLVSFYDAWIDEQPIEYTRSEAGEAVIYQRNELPPVLITVTQNHEERGEVFTYLLIAGGNEA